MQVFHTTVRSQEDRHRLYADTLIKLSGLGPSTGRRDTVQTTDEFEIVRFNDHIEIVTPPFRNDDLAVQYLKLMNPDVPIKYLGEIMDSVTDVYGARRLLRRVRFDALLTNHRITSVQTSESEVVFTLENGADLRFMAESECCDASWFVESDMDIPANLVGSTFISWDTIRITGNADETYGINVTTTAGVFHARMSNDGGDSGCYSGNLVVLANHKGQEYYP